MLELSLSKISRSFSPLIPIPVLFFLFSAGLSANDFSDQASIVDHYYIVSDEDRSLAQSIEKQAQDREKKRS